MQNPGKIGWLPDVAIAVGAVVEDVHPEAIRGRNVLIVMTPGEVIGLVLSGTTAPLST